MRLAKIPKITYSAGMLVQQHRERGHSDLSPVSTIQCRKISIQVMSDQSIAVRQELTLVDDGIRLKCEIHDSIRKGNIQGSKEKNRFRADELGGTDEDLARIQNTVIQINIRSTCHPPFSLVPSNRSPVQNRRKCLRHQKHQRQPGQRDKNGQQKRPAPRDLRRKPGYQRPHQRSHVGRRHVKRHGGAPMGRVVENIRVEAANDAVGSGGTDAA